MSWHQQVTNAMSTAAECTCKSKTLADHASFSALLAWLGTPPHCLSMNMGWGSCLARRVPCNLTFLRRHKSRTWTSHRTPNWFEAVQMQGCSPGKYYFKISIYFKICGQNLKWNCKISQYFKIPDIAWNVSMYFKIFQDLVHLSIYYVDISSYFKTECQILK